jgi:hypothetical protein
VSAADACDFCTVSSFFTEDEQEKKIRQNRIAKKGIKFFII